MNEINFEQEIIKLEEYVKQLESGNYELEEMLKIYEKAIKTSNKCQLKLNNIENKIEILTEKLNKSRGSND